ncbi:MAG TPA: chemotaxis-specific protein-glutamate methyltransferase CheB [Polyangiaceae bacterium]|nr:chemotaxis-specific protein-glutamate methyltransferase CheB [Polyangiaceae bacterium]
MSHRLLRVLVVDDSPLNRDEMVASLAATGDAEVVGMASNGSDALKLAPTLRPDVITLDLEMPKMDGFSFLRIVQNVWVCPVLVISSCSADKQVFRALELGAVDFVAKPNTRAERLSVLPNVLKEKLATIRALTPGVWSRPHAPAEVRQDAPATPRPKVEGAAPRYFIAMAASTGGPTAVTTILSQLKADARCAVLVAQHMPDTFTRTFAERLNRHSALQVSEARANEPILGAAALICPGRRCLEVQFDGSRYMTDIRFPGAQDRYVPSADRLFASLANVAPRNTIGVVLTGMGDDGMEGAKALVRRGGIVIAESQETAVVYGMPQAAVRAGIVRRSLPLDEIANYLNDLTRA